MDIHISGIKNHFFHTNNTTHKNQTTQPNQTNQPTHKNQTNQINQTKIVDYCFYSINEANISNKIKKIPYYSNYYSIVTSYDFINISNINERIVKLLDENKKYMIFTYKSQGLSKTFDEFLHDYKKLKLLILHSISTFSYLLQSLLQLQQQNLCFFQLSHENIIFNSECREKPILQNFKLSLQVSKLNETYITQIIKKTKDYSLKPLEVHVLFYLIENDLHTISYSFIEEIVEVFTRNLSILSFFSQSYRENYQIACIHSLKKYMNKPKSEIILDILLNYHDKWDVYSISLLYLHVFTNISKEFSLKQTFMNKISIELAKNIHPDPSKRGTLAELLQTHENLMNCDWSFLTSSTSASSS